MDRGAWGVLIELIKEMSGISGAVTVALSRRGRYLRDVFGKVLSQYDGLPCTPHGEDYFKQEMTVP